MGSESRIAIPQDDIEYIGFWPRVWASVIDSAIFLVVALPILLLVYGPEYLVKRNSLAGPTDFVISWVLPAAAVLIYWIKKQATPGKMAIKAKVVDAQTFRPATTRHLIIRYVAYYLSLIPFGLGFFWILVDKRKQGWHDKVANTVVIRTQE